MDSIVTYQFGVPPVPKRPKRVRIVTNLGGAFDFDVGTDFSLIALVTSIRAAGYFCNDLAYIPEPSIDGIFVYDAGTEPKLYNVVPFKPGGDVA